MWNFNKFYKVLWGISVFSHVNEVLYFSYNNTLEEYVQILSSIKKNTSQLQLVVIVVVVFDTRVGKQLNLFLKFGKVIWWYE